MKSKNQFKIFNKKFKKQKKMIKNNKKSMPKNMLKLLNLIKRQIRGLKMNQKEYCQEIKIMLKLRKNEKNFFFFRNKTKIYIFYKFII